MLPAGLVSSSKWLHQTCARYEVDISEMVIKLANQYPIIPELQVRHEWEPGDFAMWDNFGTCHYGVSGNTGGQHRRLYRVSAWSESVAPEPYV